MAVDPVKFLREVRAEVGKVTWPTRSETLKLTGQVALMSIGAALVFFLVDQMAGFAIRSMFGAGQ